MLTVAIHKHYVLSGSGSGTGFDSRSVTLGVRLRQHGDTCLLAQLLCIIRRAIVNDYYFGMGIQLSQCRQHRCQASAFVFGGNYN